MEIPGSMFTWTGTVGVAEMSDFNGHPVLDRGLPMVLNVRSHRTNDLHSFVLTEILHDQENEVYAYKWRDFSGNSIKIFND